MCNCNQNTNPCLPCGQAPCTPPQTCDCPIKDLKSDCILVTTDLPCAEIEAGQTLTETLEQMDAHVCEVKSELEQTIAYTTTILNVGDGKRVYKDVDGLGRRRLRTIKEDDNLITVVENTDTINIGVNEANLTSFIQTNQKVYDINNVGTGEKIYQEPDPTPVANLTTFNIKSLKSDSLTINSTSTEVSIEVPDSGVQKFIVNSDYTGTEEKGTDAKPYKNLQNALNAFVGTGTNKVPQFASAIIEVQKDTNTFTGSLAINNLNLVINEGVVLTSDPSASDWIIDIDSDATLPTSVYSNTPFTDTDVVNIIIELKSKSFLVLKKQGFKNRGTTFSAGLARGKVISLIGDGTITIDSDVSVVNPSNRVIINANRENLPGYFNDLNVANFGIECIIFSNNTQILYSGLNAKIHAERNNPNILFSDSVTSPSNINTKPITADGGSVYINGGKLQCYGQGGVYLNSFVTIKNSGSVRIDNTDCIGQVTNLFENSDTLDNISLNVYKSTFIMNIFNDIIYTVNALLYKVRIIDTIISEGNLDTNLITLAFGNINNIVNQVVLTLPIFTSKESAVTSGLIQGATFRKRKTVSAQSLTIGVEYQIATASDASYTLVGSINNNIGQFFTATATTNGGTTGTVYLDSLDII